jgi:haloacetate dehalogenase
MQVATRSRSKEEILERRNFLGALAGASLGVLSEGILADFASAQSATDAGATSADQISFETSHVEVSGNTIFLRRYGKGPAILLVHGFPRTSLMWRSLAPKLAEKHTVICVDLRAYGSSGIPASTDDHFPYSKRAIAKELVEVMDKLGFPTFTLIGHDRGGRVSYRLALDHPNNVERLAVFDVIPIFEAWNRSDARFAQTYWPWILLSQRSPLPESYLLGAPKAVFDNPFGHGSFAPRQRLMSNTIAPTRKRPSELNVQCCICGLRVARSTRSMEKTMVRSAFGGNGLRGCKDSQ